MSISCSNMEEFEDAVFTSFPYKIGFTKDLINHPNNYFIASLHCLINIKELSIPILASKDEEHPYCQLLTEIGKDKNDVEKNEDLINQFENYIFHEKEYNKKYNEPRNLIEFILRDLKDSNLINDFPYIYCQKKCKDCGTASTEKLMPIIELDFPKIIEGLNNKKVNKITINDCYNEFLNSLNNKKIFSCEECNNRNIEVTINKLPPFIIIFIYYRGENAHYDYSYEFDEIINLNNSEFYLSSLIACQNNGNYYETFYTYARGDKDSSYVFYNGNDVRENFNVKNKIKKAKIDLRDKKQGWPFVLVYSTTRGDN